VFDEFMPAALELSTVALAAIFILSVGVSTVIRMVGKDQESKEARMQETIIQSTWTIFGSFAGSALLT